jgi:hypothetical protein
VTGNIFVNCGDPGKGPFGVIFCHGGYDARAENNIFIDCKRALGSGPWGEATWKEALNNGGGLGFRDKLLRDVDVTKPPYSTRYPELSGFLELPPNAPRKNHARLNVFVRCGDQANGNWQLDSSTNWSTSADPGFVNAAKGDYRLRSDSVIYKHLQGFKPVYFEQMGLTKKP